MLPRERGSFYCIAVKFPLWPISLLPRVYTIVPLELYFIGGRAKVEIALARGKQEWDKRQTLRESRTSVRQSARCVAMSNKHAADRRRVHEEVLCALHAEGTQPVLFEER